MMRAKQEIRTGGMGCSSQFALRKFRPAEVRYGSIADIPGHSADVRYASRRDRKGDSHDDRFAPKATKTHCSNSKNSITSSQFDFVSSMQLNFGRDGIGRVLRRALPPGVYPY